MSKLIYENLTYKINGYAFKIDNELGFGHQEKTYSDALEMLLKKEELHYKRELYAPITFEGQIISRRYFDFLIDDKIVIEVKRGDYNFKQTYSQLLEYLISNRYKLGIIIRFTRSGVRVKRVPNFHD